VIGTTRQTIAPDGISQAPLSAGFSLTPYRVPEYSPCFTPTVVLYRLPLPSTGSTREVFPRFIGTIRSSDNSHPSFRSSVFPRPSVPPLTSVVHFSVTDVHDGTWSFFPRLPLRRCSVEMSVSPRFLGNPCVLMPRAWTPPGFPHLAIAVVPCCLPSPLRRRLPSCVFRGSITRPVHSLSTLRNACHHDITQDSLPADG
jgi:hypothetical protein